MTSPTSALNITPQTPVGRIAVTQPASISVFQRLGIDFCCSGAASLEEAAKNADVPLDEILGELIALPSNGEEEKDWSGVPLPDVIDHIVATHHAYTRTALPALWELLRKVVQVHGETHPELHAAARIVATLFTELGQHLQKEEQILFPHIRELATNPSAPRVVPDGPINVMEQDHDAAGKALRELREVTSDYRLPDDACDSYRALFSGLTELERDLHIHIHLENNVLHPRTRELV